MTNKSETHANPDTRQHFSLLLLLLRPLRHALPPCLFPIQLDIRRELAVLVALVNGGHRK
jgi:hypothetical protein